MCVESNVIRKKEGKLSNSVELRYLPRQGEPGMASAGWTQEYMKRTGTGYYVRTHQVLGHTMHYLLAVSRMRLARASIP